MDTTNIVNYKINPIFALFACVALLGLNSPLAIAKDSKQDDSKSINTSSQISKQFEAIKTQKIESSESKNNVANDSSTPNAQKSSTQESSTNPKVSQQFPTKIPTHKPKSLNLGPQKNGLQDLLIMQATLPQDFLEVQKSFPWIRYIGLAMVSFDDGSYRSGFGLLLPDKIFLTSAELAHNASAYPKEMLLKMRDDSAGNLICIAQLRLKALDKGRGLALFEVEDYTDDYCNIRTQSFYHARLMKNNAYDISKPPTQANNYFTVTTTFNNPDISVLKVGNSGGNNLELPIQNDQKVIFGRPFFSKNGVLLGMASMQENAFKPVIISNAKIKEFICAMHTSGILLPASISKICARGVSYASKSSFGSNYNREASSIKNFVPKSKTDVQKFKEYLQKQEACLQDKAAR